MLRIATLVVGVVLAASTAAQSDWPNKPIRIIAPFPPGGTVDQIARLVQPGLAQALGQTIVIENRGGGGGSIGTNIAAKAPPDGYTWVIVFDTHAVNPSLIPNMPFDTRADLAPVMLIATGTMVMTAHRTQTIKTFAEFLAAARAKPGAVSYGSIGTGSLAHLAMMQMGAQGNFNASHIPYKGGGPLAQDVVAGHVPVAVATIALLAPHIKSGTIVPLAVTSNKRDPQLPNVPTVAESGIGGFEASAWWGAYAPAKTPAPIIARMNVELGRVLQSPLVRDRMSSQGMNLVASNPETLAKFTDEQINRWARVVKEFGVRAGD